MTISPDSVCAVVLDRCDAATAATLGALAGQSCPPGRLVVAASRRRESQVRRRFGSEAVVVAGESPLSEGAGHALEVSARWIWLLDGRTMPAPGALAALLDSAASWPDQRLRLLSSTVVNPDGTLLSAAAPLPQALDPDLAVDAYERRTCSLRVAGYGSLLVHAEALRQALPPSPGIGADLIWSARLLADGAGLLVPRSIATAAPVDSARGRLRLLAGWARLLLSDGLAARDKPWVAYIYFQRARVLIAGWVRVRRPSAARPVTPSRGRSAVREWPSHRRGTPPPS